MYFHTRGLTTTHTTRYFPCFVVCLLSFMQGSAEIPGFIFYFYLALLLRVIWGRRHSTLAGGGQRTTLWSWSSSSLHTWVPGTELRSVMRLIQQAPLPAEPSHQTKPQFSISVYSDVFCGGHGFCSVKEFIPGD